MEAGDTWEAHDIVHGEGERPFDQPVHQQPMPLRRNVGNAGVVALEHESARGHDPALVLQWSEAGGRERVHAAGDRDAHDGGFIFRPLAIGGRKGCPCVFVQGGTRSPEAGSDPLPASRALRGKTLAAVSPNARPKSRRLPRFTSD